jgi:myosin heavy subunit
LVDPDPKKYFYISQGMTTIDNVDDAEEMKLTNEAFDILNFKPVNKHTIKSKV